MRFRKLRIAWSKGCGVMAVLLIALWMRSYSLHDYLAKTTSSRRIEIDSDNGFLILTDYNPSRDPRLSANDRIDILDELSAMKLNFSIWPTRSDFRPHSGRIVATARVPYWLPVALVVAAGAIVW